MSWLLNLYETYEANTDHVGEVEKRHNGSEFTLLPISHTTQTAHIEVVITEDGYFHSASVIKDKEERGTLVPCTKDAGSRVSSGVVPYPLHTKLNYAAGDLVVYGGRVKEENPYTYYIRQLKDWADSSYSHPTIRSILTYLSKKQLIRDLVKERVLYLDADGSLIEKWDKKYEGLHGGKPDIFSAINGGLDNAFIRFNVYSPTKLLTKVWKDKELYDSFIHFYKNQLGDEDYCYVTGKILPTTDKHASKIRNAGDMAKLISANDKSGFTFRGRFNKGSEVASISYDVSQKAHNALKWLINRQGKVIDQRVFLVWGNQGNEVPAPTEDSFDLASILGISEQPTITKTAFTNQEFAHEVAKAMDGYRNNLVSDSNSINIIILDSATTGRMAVLYYRNMDIMQYFDRLVNWHTTCYWRHAYRKDIVFHGAPATKDIAFAAYGPRASDKIIKGLIERMFPCIIDQQNIPLDIVRSTYYRASNPVSMEKWEWEKTLSIACALINRREGYSVTLDKDINDRDYLLGRLLAIADVLERRALGPDSTRSSNAIRYMNSFSQHPERTWKTIQASLQPYQARLGVKANYLNHLIDEVASKIRLEDFNNKPLTGKYLLGFYSQRHELYQKKDNKAEKVEQ